MMQVKYNLTNITGDDDKETIHCEFDVTNSNIEWMSGQIFVFVSILVTENLQFWRESVLGPVRLWVRESVLPENLVNTVSQEPKKEFSPGFRLRCIWIRGGAD